MVKDEASGKDTNFVSSQEIVSRLQAMRSGISEFRVSYKQFTEEHKMRIQKILKSDDDIKVYKESLQLQDSDNDESEEENTSAEENKNIEDPEFKNMNIRESIYTKMIKPMELSDKTEEIEETPENIILKETEKSVEEITNNTVGLDKDVYDNIVQSYERSKARKSEFSLNLEEMESLMYSDLKKYIKNAERKYNPPNTDGGSMNELEDARDKSVVEEQTKFDQEKVGKDDQYTSEKLEVKNESDKEDMSEDVKQKTTIIEEQVENDENETSEVKNTKNHYKGSNEDGESSEFEDAEENISLVMEENEFVQTEVGENYKFIATKLEQKESDKEEITEYLNMIKPETTNEEQIADHNKIDEKPAKEIISLYNTDDEDDFTLGDAFEILTSSIEMERKNNEKTDDNENKETYTLTNESETVTETEKGYKMEANIEESGKNKNNFINQATDNESKSVSNETELMSNNKEMIKENMSEVLQEDILIKNSITTEKSDDSSSEVNKAVELKEDAVLENTKQDETDSTQLDTRKIIERKMACSLEMRLAHN